MLVLKPRSRSGRRVEPVEPLARCPGVRQEPAISVKSEVIDLWYSGNRTADLAGKEAALTAHPDSFFTIPHFDGYRAVLIRLPQVTGAALREAITDGWLACAPPRLARDFIAG